MPDVMVKRLEDFEAGNGAFFKVRAGLGVTAWGMQVERFPANFADYPEHDHARDGQEEVYIPLKGSAALIAGGEEYRLEPGVFVRVGPHEKRRIVTGDEPIELLCIGGTPGSAYDPPPYTEEGAPPPGPGEGG